MRPVEAPETTSLTFTRQSPGGVKDLSSILNLPSMGRAVVVASKLSSEASSWTVPLAVALMPSSFSSPGGGPLNSMRVTSGGTGLTLTLIAALPVPDAKADLVRLLAKAPIYALAIKEGEDLGELAQRYIAPVFMDGHEGS